MGGVFTQWKKDIWNTVELKDEIRHSAKTYYKQMCLLLSLILKDCFTLYLTNNTYTCTRALCLIRDIV